MKGDINPQESLPKEDGLTKNEHQENLKEGRRDDKEPKTPLAKKVYVKPTCEIIEMEPIEMIAMSGEGSDTEGDHEFGEERGFSNERNRGEWGDLWKE